MLYCGVSFHMGWLDISIYPSLISCQNSHDIMASMYYLDSNMYKCNITVCRKTVIYAYGCKIDVTLKGEVLVHKSRLPHHLYIEVPVPSQENEKSCLCVLWVAIWHVFLLFNNYILERFRQHGDYPFVTNIIFPWIFKLQPYILITYLY